MVQAVIITLFCFSNSLVQVPRARDPKVYANRNVRNLGSIITIKRYTQVSPCNLKSIPKRTAFGLILKFLHLVQIYAYFPRKPKCWRRKIKIPLPHLSSRHKAIHDRKIQPTRKVYTLQQNALFNLGHGSDELLAVVNGLELFGNGHFVKAVGRRDEDVHLGGFGSDDFGVERFLAKIHLTSVGLSHGDRRNHALRLDLSDHRKGRKVKESRIDCMYELTFLCLA